MDRPDVVVRVFNMKVQAFIARIRPGKHMKHWRRNAWGKRSDVFGQPTKAYAYRIEFQKRGLPHAHFLIWLQDPSVTKTGAGIDAISQASLPDPAEDPAGSALVVKHMLHGPCDERCMDHGVCRHGFPFDFKERTEPNTTPGGGYPKYRRPDDGRTACKRLKGKGTVAFDNRHVAPYNMTLLKEFNCHFNVMVADGIKMIKYVFKYVFKQDPRANMQLTVVPPPSGVAAIPEPAGSSAPAAATAAAAAATAAPTAAPATNPMALIKKKFFDGRVIGSTEAAWRLFGFGSGGVEPSVQSLDVTLPVGWERRHGADEHQRVVVFSPDADLRQVQQRAHAPKVSQLLEWFQFNAKAKREYDHKLEQYNEAVARGERPEPVVKPAALTTRYSDVLTIATWHASKPAHFEDRKSNTGTIGRLKFVPARDRERFMLKRLLCGVEGATSYEDVRTVPDMEAPLDPDGQRPTKVCDTFEEACRELGLLENDDAWYQAMDEGVAQRMPVQLRQMYVEILTIGGVADPERFWNRYKVPMSDDHVHDVELLIDRLLHEAKQKAAADGDDPGLIDRNCIDDPAQQTIVDEGEAGRWSWQTVEDIRDLLQETHHTLAQFKIPEPPAALLTDELQKEVRSYPRFSYTDIQHNIDLLNDDQRAAFDQVVGAVHDAESGATPDGATPDGAPTVFFLNGPGGVGKTFVYKTLLQHVRHRTDDDVRNVWHVALATASNGLPAQLLPGGKTAHRAFRLPVTDDFRSKPLVCNVSKDSQHAEVLRRAKLIVWDEATASHRANVDAVDRMLRDVTGVDRLFGGKVVVLGGDFKQCLPVVKHAGGLTKRQAQVDAAARKWQHWDDVRLLHLRKNMRVEQCLQNGNQERARLLDAWARWLCQLGDGTLPLDEKGRLRVPDGGPASRLPFDVLFRSKAESKEDRELEFFERMYGPVKGLQGDARDAFLRDTAVLVAKNVNADRINDVLMESLIVGTAHTYTSLNKTTDQNAQADDQYPEEYLSSIKDGRLPAHVLRLKVGAPVIALRNITKGVSNGTRMVVTRLLRNSIFARVLHGPTKGQEVAITKVFTTHNMGAFELQRRQLPIRVAFAMTNDDQQGPGTHAPQGRRARRGGRLRARPALRRLLPVRGSRQPVRVRAAAGSRRRRLDQERRLQGGAHRGYVAVYIRDNEITFTRPLVVSESESDGEELVVGKSFLLVNWPIQFTPRRPCSVSCSGLANRPARLRLVAEYGSVIVSKSVNFKKRAFDHDVISRVCQDSTRPLRVSDRQYGDGMWYCRRHGCRGSPDGRRGPPAACLSLARESAAVDPC